MENFISSQFQKEQMLETLKTNIENLEKIHHIEILKILKKNANIKLNENKNGIYINLTFVPDETIAEINNYLSYVQDQEKTIMETEQVKESMKKLLVSYEEVEQQLQKKHPTLSY